MCCTTNDEANQSNDIDHEDARDLSIIAADRPGQPKEGSDADKAGNERGSLQRGAEGGEEKEQTKETKEDSTMAHEDGKVGLVNGQAIKRGKAFAPEHT